MPFLHESARPDAYRYPLHRCTLLFQAHNMFHYILLPRGDSRPAGIGRNPRLSGRGPPAPWQYSMCVEHGHEASIRPDNENRHGLRGRTVLFCFVAMVRRSHFFPNMCRTDHFGYIQFMLGALCLSVSLLERRRTTSQFPLLHVLHPSANCHPVLVVVVVVYT